MRTIPGKILSIVLVLCMVFALFPSNALANVWAADTDDTETETTDAFGINISNEDTVLTEGTNPLGSNDEGWTTLFEVSELNVAFTNSSESKNWIYDYTNENKRDSWPDYMGYFNNAYDTKTSVSMSKSYYILDTAPVNIGNGKKEYTAYLGYNHSDNKVDQVELSLLGPDGTCVSNTLGFGENGELDYLYEADGDYKSAYLSVTAGDFDGDGIDTIIAYVPVQRGNNSDTAKPYIVECSVDPDTLQLTKNEKNVSDDVYKDLTKVSTDMTKKSSSDDGRLRNVPTIAMTTGDTDRDGVDELVITANMNHPTDYSSGDEFASCMSIYDFVSGGWQQTYQLNTQTYRNDGISDDINSEKRLRAASSAVGNIMTSNNGVDFPEIVTAGHVEEASGKSTTDVKGEVGSVVTICTGCEGSGTESVGTYQSQYMTMDSVGGFTKDGFKCGSNYPRWPLVPVAIGTGEDSVNCQVVIADTVYEYSGSYFKAVLLPKNLESSYGSVNGHKVTTQWVEDIVVGNFDGNEEGKEQFFVLVMAKRQGKNQFSARIYTYFCDVSGEENEYGWDYHNNGGEWYWTEDTSLTMSLCALDVDNDSTIGRLLDTETSWSEPEPFAVLEAAPYYAELGVSGETVYSTSQSSGSSESSSSSLSSSVTVGYEASFLGFGAGMEAKIESSVTWETVTSESVEYSIDYTNNSGENAVVVARRQATAYTYEVYGTDQTITLMTQGDLATSLVTLDDYNEIVEQYDNLNPISESELATPGDPFSYRANTFGLSNVATSTYYSSSVGSGSQTHSISETTEEENSCTYDMNFTFETWATAGGAKAGVGAGAGVSSGTTTVTGSGKAMSGTVEGTATDGYSFNWRLIRWMIPLSGNTTTVPVIGYLLDSVIGLPSPPINLSVDAESLTQTSATLTWENAGGNRSCETYYIYQIYSNGEKVQIGEIDGTEVEYELAGLSPDTSYTYAISAYTSSGSSKGESVLSDEVVVTTLPEGVGSVEILDPEDASVKVGGTATFKTDITVSPGTYRAENHQWQMRTSGGSWEDIKGETSKNLTLSDLQLSDNEAQVRAVFKVSYSNATSAVTYYSNPATITVGAAPVTTALEVTGYDENNDNDGTTQATPYTGLSEYWKLTTTKKTVDYTSDVVLDVTDKAGEIVMQLTVCYTTDGQGNPVDYYGYNSSNGICYKLTISGDEYIVGDPVTVNGEKDVFAGDDVPEDLYPDMPLIESEITVEAENEEETRPVYLVAAVTTENDGITGIIYYWYEGSEDTYYQYNEEDRTVGEKVTENLSESTLYDVYSISSEVDENDETVNTFILLGLDVDEIVDDETAEGYQYYLLTVNSEETMIPGTESDPQYGTKYTYTMKELTVETTKVTDGLDLAALTTATTTVPKTLTSTSLEKVEGVGNELTLTATVLEDDEDKSPAVGATVDFQITNLTTLTMETLTATVGEDGVASVTWTASTDGLYSIQYVVRKDSNYALTKSEKLYYEAGATYTENTTEYRLELQQNGESVDGAINYGESIDLTLFTRDVTVDNNTMTYGAWKDFVGEVTYSYIITGGEQEDSIENPVSFKPETAGSYTFYAYINGTDEDEGDKIALAALNVNPLAIIITPTWDKEKEEYPVSEDEVILTADITLVESPDTNSYLRNNILDIASDYFEMTDEEKANASGQYMIYLGYISGDENDDSPETKAALATMNAFRTNYVVTLENASFQIKKRSARIDFSCGVDGTISGMYADNDYVMTSGSSKTEGTALSFVATPDDGYSIDHWTINGIDYVYGGDLDLPDGMHFTSSGKKLKVEGLDLTNHTENGVLTVYVEFISTPCSITYETEGEGGTVSAVTGSSAIIDSGESVAMGADVILTAVPEDGYAVACWKVNGEIYTWDYTSEEYRGTTLTLSNISDDAEIQVFFKAINPDPWSVTVEIVDEDGNDASYLAEVTAENKETGEAVELPASVVEDTTLTLNASLYQQDFNSVSKWEIISTNEEGTQTDSVGAKNEATAYNIDGDTVVRLVLKHGERVNLNYEVQLNGKTVDDPDVASLTASCDYNGYVLESGKSYAKHIPVDFTLTIGDAYYLIGWSDNVTVGDNSMSATIDPLSNDTDVVVTIADKPVVTIPETEGGTITVTGTKNGEKDVTLENGDYFDPGTELTVTLTPNPGYIVSYPDAAYTDGTGSTTDEMTYVISDADKDLTIADSFTELAQVTIEYCVESESVDEGDVEVDVDDAKAEDDLGGSLSASVDRKGIEEYDISDLQSGDKVYVGSHVMFVAKPDKGWRVKQWTVNGEVYVDEDGVTVDANTLEFDDVTDDMVVTVLFEEEEIVVAETTVNTGTTTKILQLRGTAKKSSASLKWNKVKNADGYKIYQAKCGKKMKLVKTIKNGSKNTLKVKKLKKGTCYKFVVKAYKTVNGKDVIQKTSNVAHVATTGGKFTNVKKVKLDKSLKSVKLKVGKTKKLPAKKIKTKTTLVNSKKKLRNHANVIYFRTTDSSVATVGKKNGKIKAQGKGTCQIYVYAADGQYAKVKVTVK